MTNNNVNHLDTIVSNYCSFSSIENKKINPIQELIQQATNLTSEFDSDEDDEKKKLAAAKKLLFAKANATSFSEVAETLRTERRQEFCPIYTDETPEEIAKRQAKRKPIGSLLAKRIRWDDLKRKREEEDERRRTNASFRYGPYGPIHSNTQQQTFANPYEQYYSTVQNQYEQMAQMHQIQQQYTGFWPEYSQNQTYPYPSMYGNSSAYANSDISSTNYDSHLNYLRQPPPPPPNEPYPY